MWQNVWATGGLTGQRPLGIGPERSLTMQPRLMCTKINGETDSSLGQREIGAESRKWQFFGAKR